MAARKGKLTTGPAADRALDRFIARYAPAVQRLAKAVLAKMRARLPGAVELVYDNYNALVVGFGANDRPSEAVFSIALFPRWVTLCFIWGAGLPDPAGLLAGGGNQVRHLRLSSADVLDDPRVKKLMAEAVRRSAQPFVRDAPRQIIVKSVSARQRPRRPAGKTSSPRRAKRTTA